MLSGNELIKRVEKRRARELTILSTKLAKVDRWRKRHAFLSSNPTWENTTRKRFKRLIQLLEENGIQDICEPIQGVNNYFTATYNRGEVIISVLGSIDLRSDGVLRAKVFRAADYERVLFITVGKTERITNHVLSTLLIPISARPPF